MKSYRKIVCCKCDKESNTNYYYSTPEDWITIDVKIQRWCSQYASGGFPLCLECQEKYSITKPEFKDTDSFEERLRDFILEVMSEQDTP